MFLNYYSWLILPYILWTIEKIGFLNNIFEKIYALLFQNQTGYFQKIKATIQKEFKKKVNEYIDFTNLFNLINYKFRQTT